MRIVSYPYNYRKYREKALEFADRVSLQERLYIRYLGTRDLNKRLELAEQRDWPGKAIEHYEKFLEVWKDADPGLPEVEDAKNRLEEL